MWHCTFISKSHLAIISDRKNTHDDEHQFWVSIVDVHSGQITDQILSFESPGKYPIILQKNLKEDDEFFLATESIIIHMVVRMDFDEKCNVKMVAFMSLSHFNLHPRMLLQLMEYLLLVDDSGDLFICEAGSEQFQHLDIPCISSSTFLLIGDFIFLDGSEFVVLNVSRVLVMP